MVEVIQQSTRTLMVDSADRVILFILKEGKLLKCKEFAEVPEVKSIILLKHEVNLNEVDPSGYSD